MAVSNDLDTTRAKLEIAKYLGRVTLVPGGT